MDTTEESIAKFLRELKEIITAGRGLDLIPREENNQTIIELGLNRASVQTEIISLSVVDYCAGPEPDRDRPGEIWTFGREINGYEIYIKLKIVDVGAVRLAKCLSFHKAVYPLRYPFR